MKSLSFDKKKDPRGSIHHTTCNDHKDKKAYFGSNCLKVHQRHRQGASWFCIQCTIWQSRVWNLPFCHAVMIISTRMDMAYGLRCSSCLHGLHLPDLGPGYDHVCCSILFLLHQNHSFCLHYTGQYCQQSFQDHHQEDHQRMSGANH